MAFNLSHVSAAYWWPVSVETPDPERVGKFLKSTFEMKFEAIGLSEIEKRLAAIRETVKGSDAQDAALVEQIVQDWRGVIGDDGNELAFSKDTLRHALEFTWFRLGAYKAMREATTSGQA